jgi:hypothetical protein
MNSNAGKIAAGTSVLGLGGVAAVALAAGGGETHQASAAATSPAPQVQTITTRRVIHRTIHLKPKHPHAVAHPVAATPVVVQRAVLQRPAVTPAAPAPAGKPLRTRTSGSASGGESDDRGHENEHEGADD